MSGRELRFVQRQFQRRTAEAKRRGRTVRGSRRMAWADEAVHVAANEIVRIAHEHRAVVVLEDLSALSAIGRRQRRPGRGGLASTSSSV